MGFYFINVHTWFNVLFPGLTGQREHRQKWGPKAAPGSREADHRNDRHGDPLSLSKQTPENLSMKTSKQASESRETDRQRED